MEGVPVRRILLLALLPVIASILYLEGQRYDPALIRFSADDLAAGGQAALLPDRVGTMVRSGPLRTFSKDNLYEYVNGHAEYFLSAGFESLTVGDYLGQDNPTGQADLVADIYDMGKPLYAATVLADETGGTPGTLPFGAVGARSDQGISFTSGKYYIRIGIFRADAPVEEFAAAIHRLIIPDKTAAVPVPTNHLPDLPDAGPIRFVKEAYRGLDFANNIQERTYTVNDVTVQVALATGEPVEMEELRAAYLDFFTESDVPVETRQVNGQTVYKIADPYEGIWYLLERAGALLGIYGAPDITFLATLHARLWPEDGAASKEAP